MEVNNTKTQAVKNRWKVWESRTDFNLNETQVLRIHTTKTDVKGESVVQTTAAVWNKGVTGSFTFAASLRDKKSGDYYAKIATEAIRCTEGTVNGQHTEVLLGLEYLKAAALAHYAAQKHVTG
jgi:hypothetical protein